MFNWVTSYYWVICKCFLPLGVPFSLMVPFVKSISPFDVLCESYVYHPFHFTNQRQGPGASPFHEVFSRSDIICWEDCSLTLELSCCGPSPGLVVTWGSEESPWPLHQEMGRGGKSGSQAGSGSVVSTASGLMKAGCGHFAPLTILSRVHGKF